MNIQSVPITPENIHRAFAIMEQAFPKCEHRSWEGQAELLSIPSYRIQGFENDAGDMVAILAIWELRTFAFIEHVAVHDRLRGSGVGARLVTAYCDQAKCPVILEVETPEDEMSTRRIGFYQRLGFTLCEQAYRQPPLQPDCPWIDMHLMCYPMPLDAHAFEEAKRTLYEQVYRRTKICAD